MMMYTYIILGVVVTSSYDIRILMFVMKKEKASNLKEVIPSSIV